MKNHKNSFSPFIKGFTLLELLVSMTVTVIVVGLLVFVARSAFSSLATGTNDISSAQRVQLALDQITSDLESMEVLTEPQYQWLAAEAINTSAVFDAVADGGGNNFHDRSIFENQNVSPATNGYFSRLAFFTKAKDKYDGAAAGGPGNVSCVEYGVGYGAPITGGNNTFVLYRQLINPDYTFNTLFKTPAVAGVPASILGLLDTNRDKTSRTVAAPGGPPLFKNPCYLDNPSYLICDNIKEFSLTFHIQYTDATGNVVITKVPVVEVNAALSDETKVEKFELNGTGFTIVDGSGTAGNTAAALVDIDANGGIIVAVDINLQVLNDEGLALLNAGAPNNIIEEKITRYTRTVNLPLYYGNSL